MFEISADRNTTRFVLRLLPQVKEWLEEHGVPYVYQTESPTILDKNPKLIFDKEADVFLFLLRWSEDGFVDYGWL